MRRIGSIMLCPHSHKSHNLSCTNKNQYLFLWKIHYCWRWKFIFWTLKYEFRTLDFNGNIVCGISSWFRRRSFQYLCRGGCILRCRSPNPESKCFLRLICTEQKLTRKRSRFFHNINEPSRPVYTFRPHHCLFCTVKNGFNVVSWCCLHVMWKRSKVPLIQAAMLIVCGLTRASNSNVSTWTWYIKKPSETCVWTAKFNNIVFTS